LSAATPDEGDHGRTFIGVWDILKARPWSPTTAPFGEIVAMLTLGTLFSTMLEASAIDLIALGFVMLGLAGLGLAGAMR
jgi:hypothetical protein